MLLENPYIPLLTHPILQEEEAATRLKLKAQEIEQFDRIILVIHEHIVFFFIVIFIICSHCYYDAVSW